MDKKQKPNKHYVEYTRQELRRLQHWFAGFQAAGGKLPPCMSTADMPRIDLIQKAIHLINEHIKVSDD